MTAPTEKHMEIAQVIERIAVRRGGSPIVADVAEELAQAERDGFRDGMKRAAEIAQRYADQNDAEAKKLMRRAGRLRKTSDPFGLGEMAADGCAEVTAAQHEAQSIASAILSESGEPDQ